MATNESRLTRYRLCEFIIMGTIDNAFFRTDHLKHNLKSISSKTSGILRKPLSACAASEL